MATVRVCVVNVYILFLTKPTDSLTWSIINWIMINFKDYLIMLWCGSISLQQFSFIFIPSPVMSNSRDNPHLNCLITYELVPGLCIYTESFSFIQKLVKRLQLFCKHGCSTTFMGIWRHGIWRYITVKYSVFQKQPCNIASWYCKIFSIMITPLTFFAYL